MVLEALDEETLSEVGAAILTAFAAGKTLFEHIVGFHRTLHVARRWIIAFAVTEALV